MSAGCVDERVRDEIEALEAILMNDVTVELNENGVPERIVTVVLPSTADDTRQQYVCLTLDIRLVAEYPDREPLVQLRNPRGLDDALIADIHRATKDKCVECLGQPVVFELIELIRERLTESNVPSCQCAVCLYDFQHGDHFTKTQCYHYFHSYCLACHLVSTERHYREEQDKLPAWQRQAGGVAGFQALCPVCREAVTCDLPLLKQAPPPLELENARQFEVTAELRALQTQMAALFSRQLSRGGIIDVAADESKLLLVTGGGESDGESPAVPPPLRQSECPPAGHSGLPPPPVHGRHRGYHHRGYKGRGGKGRHYQRSSASTR